MNLNDHFRRIRATYDAALLEWLADYEATGNMWNDPYLMDWEFSPIERLIWGEIRDMCLPFYPQLPALNYFLDFGNPFLKIGIECDGKQFHDKARDAARDARLAGAGWMIFRIDGHECVRSIDRHWDGSAEERPHFDAEKFYGSTAEGVLRAIKRRYFDDKPATDHACLARQTLHQHRSTPETDPVRRPVSRRAGPVHIADLMAEHFDLMQCRAVRIR